MHTKRRAAICCTNICDSCKKKSMTTNVKKYAQSRAVICFVPIYSSVPKCVAVHQDKRQQSLSVPDGRVIALLLSRAQ